MAKCATKTFTPLGIALLTVSDRHTFETDTSGEYLQSVVETTGHHCIDRQICRDNPHYIRAVLSQWIINPDIHSIIVNGGTGFTECDNTPHAVSALFDREMSGFGELFRQLSFDDIGTSCLQSRAIGGLANQTAIFCIPGSPGACRLGWEHIIQAQLDARTRPCNFVSHLLKKPLTKGMS